MTEKHDHHPETQLSGRLRALSDSACSRVGAAQHTAARREHVRVLRLSPWCPPRRPRSRAGAQGRSALIQTVAPSSRNPSHRTHACTLLLHLFLSECRTAHGSARRARDCASPISVAPTAAAAGPERGRGRGAPRRPTQAQRPPKTHLHGRKRALSDSFCSAGCRTAQGNCRCRATSCVRARMYEYCSGSS